MVAAAWAMIAGWYRTDGQVTPVARPIRVVFAAITGRTLQVNGAVTLRLQPRMVVVAHLHEVKTGLLGQHGLPDELGGTERFGGELVPDPHVLFLSRGNRRCRYPPADARHQPVAPHAGRPGQHAPAAGLQQAGACGGRA